MCCRRQPSTAKSGIYGVHSPLHTSCKRNKGLPGWFSRSSGQQVRQRMDARPVAGCALMRHPVTDCQYTLSALDCSFLMQLLQAMPFKTQFRGEIYWRLVLVGCHLQPAAASNHAVGSHNSLCRGTLPATLFAIAPFFKPRRTPSPTSARPHVTGL